MVFKNGDDSQGFYKLFGLPFKSDISAIKKAYRKKQAELHPNGRERTKLRQSESYKKLSEKEKEKKEQELNELIGKINQAYSVLGNEEKKKQYDEGTGEFSQFQGFDGFSGFDDIFSAFTGRSRQQREPKLQDTVTTVKITFKESFLGKTSKFKIKTTKICSPCGGKGFEKVVSCKKCNGRGKVYISRQMGMMIAKTEVKCPECDGRGEVGQGPRCGTCKGEQVLKEPRIKEIRIRAGVQDGEQIVLKNEGNQAPGCKAGNLVFVVKIEEDPVYRRIENDIISKVDVDLYTVLAGGSIYYEHLDNKKYNIRIEKITDFKKSIRIDQLGFKNNGLRGDLYLDLNIKVNKKIDKEALAKVLPPSISKPQGSYENVYGDYFYEPKEKKRTREEFDSDENYVNFEDIKSQFGGFTSFF